MQELGFENKSILDADINYDLGKWKRRENDLANTIDRMGPINLAAIDQFKEYEERKSYLNMQKDDLHTALESLEDAIKKIDKDTKERFKDTFEKVDKKLQEIFPKLFNGGKAYLKMTENDLLKTGVAVYASPPGKKTNINKFVIWWRKSFDSFVSCICSFFIKPITILHARRSRCAIG